MSRIRFRHDGLAGQLYTARSDNSLAAERLAVVCPGLPYVPTEEYVTKILLGCQYDVIQVQYPGTYDSEGVFCPESAIGVVSKILELCDGGVIADPKTNEMLPLNRRVDTLIGHSFGSYVVLRSLSEGASVPNALVAAPFFAFGAARINAGVIANLSGHAAYLKRAMPHTIRMSSMREWHDFFLVDPERIAIDAYQGATLPACRILPVVGERDPSFNVEALQKYVGTLAVSLQTRGSRLAVEPLMVVPGAGHGLEETISDEVMYRFLGMRER